MALSHKSAPGAETRIADFYDAAPTLRIDHDLADLPAGGMDDMPTPAAPSRPGLSAARPSSGSRRLAAQVADRVERHVRPLVATDERPTDVQLDPVSARLKKVVSDVPQKPLAPSIAKVPVTKPAASFEKRPTEPLPLPAPVVKKTPGRIDPAAARDAAKGERILAQYAKSGHAPSHAAQRPSPAHRQVARKAPAKGFWQSIFGFLGFGSGARRASRPGKPAKPMSRRHR